jgi:hypothetical protein
MYSDYLKETQNRKRNSKKLTGRKHFKRHNFDTVEEAFLSLDKKVSSKLNYAALESLFDQS